MKTKFFITLCVTAMYMFNHLCAQSNSARLDEAKKAIAASNEIYFQAFVKNDESLLIDRYTDDCWIMLPHMPVLSGPNAVHDFFRIGYDKAGVRDGKLISVDVYGISEDIVAEIGFWKLYDATNKEMEDGKFLVLWKKTSKGWKMWKHSSSTNRNRA